MIPLLNIAGVLIAFVLAGYMATNDEPVLAFICACAGMWNVFAVMDAWRES